MAASILSVVLGAILSLSSATAQLAPNDEERAHQIDDARAGVYRMTRELRQARQFVSSSSYSITVVLTAGTVTYTCNNPHPSITGRSRCTRSLNGGTAAPVIDHLTNVANNRPVFTRSGNYVAVNARVAASGDRRDGHRHTLTFEDGFYMRNVP